MFCSKCGKPVENGSKYCNNCGNFLGTTVIQTPFKQDIRVDNSNQHLDSTRSNANSNKKLIFLGIGIGLFIIIILVIIFGIRRSDYHFFPENYGDGGSGKEVSEKNKKTSTKGKYQTIIITDNVYNGMKISNDADAYQLIEEDSVSQKDNCPSEIKQIEDEIIKKYNITAVNLCEMDVDFARELENVFEVIYREYPGARGYITNLTLWNTSGLSDSGVIAAFMPVFPFATSDSDSSYPWVIKTQVLLSSKFFLNKSRLESSTKGGSSSGHFPPNSTIYSPVAHELGHYLSFLAMMNYYKVNSILLINDDSVDTFYKLYSDFGDGNYSLSMINEAYENYKKDTGTTMSLDEWRGTISKYALAKDNNGEYIYDETIAEAFHDVYLNNDNAKDASKYIVKVLKEKLR